MIVIANQSGEVDSAYHSLVRHIKTDLPIVMVSWSENFIFNDDLLSIKNPIIIDFCEYGYDWDLNKSGSHIWGVNSEKFARYYNKGWVTFDKWVKENPPKILFKRELLKKDVSDTVKPIEYPCIVEHWPSQHKELFDARPLNVFQYWGRSNEHRLRIHGEIWVHAYKKGFSVCDNLYYMANFLKNEIGEKWATLWIPHWARIDIEHLMVVNNVSKLSLSWEGAGNKCFRSAEAPVNSVMVMHRNELAWTFPWDESNCILVEHSKEIEGIEEALKYPHLHDIYLQGILNCHKYRLETYLPHIEKLINDVL